VCPGCGISYKRFSTGLDYQAVYDMMCVPSDDPKDWRCKSRHGVLGFWREIKQGDWRRHMSECIDLESADDGRQGTTEGVQGCL